MFGFLNLNKPAGKTSREVVNQIQRLVRPVKVGHGGTLDPLATGVLVVALGPATRLIEYVQAQPKTYQAVFRLGQASNTEDLEGELTVLVDPPQPTRVQIEEVLPRFEGCIKQVPPAYSAIKIDGKRAYKLARGGKDIELSARTITVYALKLGAYTYPDLELEIHCGGGTYVRSLGRDIARELGTEAVMVSLVRTAIGGFELTKAIDAETLTSETLDPTILPPRLALADHPTFELNESQLRQLQNGRPVQLPDHPTTSEAPHILAFDHQQRLQAVLRPTEQGWRVAKSFWDAHGTPPQRSAN